jgi:indolepyruvate ferredoxin oxidoreductase alpha subunit
VALEVGIGAAFAGARALVTMKHVGLNVAADPLFTVAYTGVTRRAGDRLGRRSGHGFQPERTGQPALRVAAGVPDAGAFGFAGAYDFTLRAIEISERWQCRCCCA